MKFGIDPTRDRLHLGHFVPLRVVRAMQDLGHEVHLVLGTFTAQMGDPSGQDRTRPILAPADVRANAERILEQVGRILLPGFTVHRNHEWFDAMTVPHLLTRVASRFTVANLLARDGFRQRTERNQPIGLHELVVPLLQGWDSVVLRADVEVGGSDQLFNFAVTRELQVAEDQPPESCLLASVIDGTDGRKMSKSFGNCVFLDEPAEDIFGKTMSIPDEVMPEWVRLLTDGIPEHAHPMERKKALAHDIVRQLRGPGAADAARAHFERTVQRGEVAEDLPTVPAGPVLDAVAALQRVSRSAARRLVEGGAVRIDGEAVSDARTPAEAGSVLRVGRRSAARVV